MDDEFQVAGYFSRIRRNVTEMIGQQASKENESDLANLAVEISNIILGAIDVEPVGIGSSIISYSTKKFAEGFKSMLKATGSTDYDFLSNEDLDALRNVNNALYDFSKHDFWRNVYNHMNCLPLSEKTLWERELVRVLSVLRGLAIDADEINTEIFLFLRRISYVPRAPTEPYQVEAINLVRRDEFQKMGKNVKSLSIKINSLQRKLPLVIDAMLLHIVGPNRKSSLYTDEYFESPAEQEFEKDILERSLTPKISAYLEKLPTIEKEYDEVETRFQELINKRELATINQLRTAGENYGQDGNLMASRNVSKTDISIADQKLMKDNPPVLNHPRYKAKTNFFGIFNK